MTPYQYLFPYFLDHARLQEALKDFDMMAHLKIDHDRKDEEQLIIAKRHQDRDGLGHRIDIQHGQLFMMRENLLFLWTKYENGIEISQFDFLEENFVGTCKTDFIDIASLEPGIHHRTTQIDYNYFVTFIRKTNLMRKEEFHEQYVILILNKSQIQIIPFDSFNETGGDPMYMWPAVASLDLSTGKLHGYGMRMGSFTMHLDLKIGLG